VLAAPPEQLAPAWLRDVLVTPGWPRGFCPVHCLEGDAKCHGGCVEARVEVARIDHELTAHWRRLGLEPSGGWR
jgi:hypothetical protein